MELICIILLNREIYISIVYKWGEKNVAGIYSR